MTAYLIVPTYGEAVKLRKWLECARSQVSIDLRAVVINGKRDRETTRVIEMFRQRLAVVELLGSPEKYWSGQVNLGLAHVLDCADDSDYALIANVDVEFGSEAVAKLVESAVRNGRSQLGAVIRAGDVIQSSGVQVRSWTWCRNHHPLAGQTQVPSGTPQLLPVDFLPARFTALPVDGIRRAGRVEERWLPHYGADYEWTARLARSGCAGYIDTSIEVECDMLHTGNNIYLKPLRLKERIVQAGSLKSEYNPWYRSVFIALSYPWYAMPTAIALYLAKSILEVGLGGRGLRRVGLARNFQ